MMLSIRLSLFSLVLLSAFNVYAININDLLKKPVKPLTVEQAFEIESNYLDNEIIVQFNITKGYYLYRHKLKFSLDEQKLENIIVPSGNKIRDDYLGEVEVFYYSFNITIPLNKKHLNKSLTIEYQGCAELGLCYPLHKKVIELKF